MFKYFKTEIDPTPEQKDIINKTIGVCRYVYNFYISYNKEVYEKEKRFVTGYEFNKWLNNEYIPNNPDKKWIKEVSSKAISKSIKNGYTAFIKFFEHKENFPKFKKKNKSDVKMYFVKNSKTEHCFCERHRIKIPTLGWVKIKEKGYIPTTKDGFEVISGTISITAGRYYISALLEFPDIKTINNNNDNEGIGIDLGLKDFAVISNGKIYKNINKASKIKKLEKKLNKQQKLFFKKYKNNLNGKNSQKQKLKIQKLYHQIYNIRTDYINKVIAEIVKTKPSYITIENLNISEMTKNKYLSKEILSQKFYEFKDKLSHKCNQNGIELRIVDRWYPSSKICHNCGNIKKDLKLYERIYKCEQCGYIEDRDLNAALNLRDAKEYKNI